MTDPLVEIESVGKVYEPSPWWLRLIVKSPIEEPVTALESVSLTVGAGEVCAVVGPNGAGKSTLFRILTGLTTPTTGRARVLGYDVERQAPKVRRLVGFMPAENRTLFLRFSAVENLAFHGRLQGIPEGELEARIEESLAMVGLLYAAERAVFAMSSGMKARLQLARAIIHAPPVLILDEPTGAVDPIGSKELLDIVQQYARTRRAAVLISSHRLEEIEALDDNVVLLDQGHLVHWGGLDELRSVWERPLVDLTFTDELARSSARQSLESSGADIVMESDLSLTLSTNLPVGSLLGCLDSQLESLVSIDKNRMPIRDLLGVMLGRHKELRSAVSDDQARGDEPASALVDVGASDAQKAS